jgi:GNAT superfamily N-acetyltransferase
MRDMFVAIRRGPLDAAGFDERTVERLMQHQYDLQRAGYRFAYPSSASEAIVVDGDVVGRLITHDSAERVVLVDIMIDPAHQRLGIGSRVLADVIARARIRPVELRVDHSSQAEPWYRRHGFEQVGADDLQAHLVHVPATAALASAEV